MDQTERNDIAVNFSIRTNVSTLKYKEYTKG